MNSCGVFAVPSSLVASTTGLFGAYHPNVTAGLGSVYSPDGTWTGLDRCGDYWVPGSPEESFVLQWGSSPAVYKNAALSCFSSDVPGNVRSFVATSGTQEVLWQGRTSDAAQTIRVRQTSRLDPAGRLLRRERLSGADAHDLALHGLAPGLYLVVLRGPAGTGHRRLVVE